MKRQSQATAMRFGQAWDFPMHYLIRFGRMPQVAVFDAQSGGPFQRGQLVRVRTDRGIEVGEVLSPATQRELPKRPAEDERWHIIGSLDPAQSATRHRNDQQRISRDLTNWAGRVARLRTPLELIDLEYLLDDTAVLYVLAPEEIELSALGETMSKLLAVPLVLQRIGQDGKLVVPAPKGACGNCSCGKS